MLKKRSKNWKIIFFLSLFVISSCQKEPIDQISASKQTFSPDKHLLMMVKDKSDAPLVSKWLELHQLNMKQSEKTILAEIIRTLNYSRLQVETRKNGESLVIIPLNNSIREPLNSISNYLKFNDNTIFNLLIVQSKGGKLRWSTLIGYSPEEGSVKTSLTPKTVQNTLNGENIADNGLYKFVNLRGKLQYQLVYKKGQLYTSAVPVREDLLKGDNSLKSNGQAARGGCFAHYLITTTYYSDGHVERTEEYLFTACDQDVDAGGGGGGGDNPGENPDPEDPNDQTVTIYGSADVFESAYGGLDYQVPITTDNPAEMDLDENGNPYPPVSLPMTLRYSHTWHYTKRLLYPFTITGVYMNDATVHPAHLTYQTAQGWVTRDVNLIAQVKDATTTGGGTADLRWKYNVEIRHTNTTLNQTTITLRPPKYHYQTIPF